MAGLYPSLEDMTADHIIRGQVDALTRRTEGGPGSNRPGQVEMPSGSVGLPYPVASGGPEVWHTVYPGLAGYMGLEFNEETLRQNMPEYLPENVPSANLVAPGARDSRTTFPGGMVAPLSGGSLGLSRSQINHGIRQVILCKDADGKVGLRVRCIDKGVFVALVTKGTPAALGGLRFGDQILQINDGNVAGYSEDQVHKLFKRAPENNIVLAVRDRPFERTLTLLKDSTGFVGFQFKDGEIKSIVVDSSAARNGLLISHQLVEVNGQNVVGMKDREISDIMDSAGEVVTVTVIPSFLYKHMMKNMSSSLAKKMMDHSIPDM